MSKSYQKKTESIKSKIVPRLSFEDFKEMDKLLIENDRAKIQITKNKSGIHIDFRTYKSIYNE